ncbi:MAG: nucleotidyltransferase family protein [Endozoicomonas sp.]
MNKKLDITSQQQEALQMLLHRYLPATLVWAYGSRVSGNSYPASDLDLVAFASPAQSAAISELREALEESNLPFRVDLFVWEQVPESFRANIMAAYVVIQGEG